MILALTKTPARRLATVGLVALLVAGCTAIPTVTPTASPAAPATVAPTGPAYTLGPTMSPSPNACPTSAPPAFSGTATVTMTTNYGNFIIKVDGSLGPNAAGSFVALSRCGYYNNVIFQRVVPGFVIQAGDGTYGRLPKPDLSSRLGSGGPGWTVPDDKVTTKYARGTVALARTSAANSGNSFRSVTLASCARG